MVKNSRSPDKLSAEIIRTHRQSVEATITICQLFAEGWSYYEDDAWDNQQVSDFLTAIHEAGFGPNPRTSVLRQGSDGRFKIDQKAASFFFIKTVGEHEMFKDADMVKKCQVTGYSVLYQLTRFYDVALGKRKNQETAKKKTLVLLTRGSELTREEINAAREELKPASHSPVKATSSETQPTTATTSYEELVQQGKGFGNLFLTPPSDVLDEIANSSLDTLDEKYSYYDLRDTDAEVSILVDGGHLNSAMKLATTMGKSNPNVYCVTKEATKSRIVNLTEEKVLVTTQSIKPPKSIPKNQGADEVVRGLIENAKGENLQLFGDGEVAGWSVCVGSDGSTPNEA
jgi:hypothetical protein